VVTLAEALSSAQKLDYVGGLAYLAALVQNVPTAANIRHYATSSASARCCANWQPRRADRGSRLQPAQSQRQEVLDEAEAAVLHIAEQGARSARASSRSEAARHRRRAHRDALQPRRSVAGDRRGHRLFRSRQGDRGLQPGDLIVVAGRPSMGKTALALNFAEHVALGLKLPVAIFSMEMGASQLALRMIGSVSRLDQQLLRTGRIAHDDWAKLSDALGRLHDAPILIDETPALTRSRCARALVGDEAIRQLGSSSSTTCS
jgi:replicative DNA helicase